MNPATASRPSNGALRRVRLAVAFACAMIVVLIGLYTWQDLEETTSRAEQRARELSSFLELFAARTLREAETAMRIAGTLAPAERARAEELDRFVAITRARHPYLAALFIAGEDGVFLGDSQIALGPALLRWSAQVRLAADRMSIGEPLRVDNEPHAFIPLAARVAARDGGDSVVALAALRADFMNQLHRNLGLAGDAASVLVGETHRILARTPYVDRQIGRDVSQSPLYGATVAGERIGAVRLPSGVDGIDRIWGHVRLQDYPLLAAIGFGLDDALAPWRRRAWRNAVIAFALMALTAVLGRVGARAALGEELARAALARSEEVHRRTLATLTEGVVRQARDGAITSWNQAALDILGLTADQLQGRTSMDPRWRAIHEDGSDFPGSEHPAMRALATGESQLKVLMGVETGERERRWIEISSMPTLVDGQLTGVTTSFVDVTERRVALEKIRNLNQELEERVASRTATLERTSADLEELVYSMAHTMRAPLRHITSFATLLEEDARKGLSEEHLDLLKRIRESAERQARLVDDLLKYTSGHQHPPVRAHISMDALVDAVIRDTRDRMADAGRVDWIRSPLPRLYGDPAMVSEVLEILISNAVKFSARAEAPSVEIAACVMDGNPGVLVRDNGVGFDMRFADKLFGMFQRLHEGEGFRGSGIDLAIAKRLVERHGGRIEAEGTVGRGATFRFTLGGAQPRVT